MNPMTKAANSYTADQIAKDPLGLILWANWPVEMLATVVVGSVSIYLASRTHADNPVSRGLLASLQSPYIEIAGLVDKKKATFFDVGHMTPSFMKHGVDA